MSRRTRARFTMMVVVFCCVSGLVMAARSRMVETDEARTSAGGDGAGAAIPAKTRAERVSALTEEVLRLQDVIEAGPPGAVVEIERRAEQLLRERHVELVSLIEEDPAAALATSLDAEAVARVGSNVPGAKDDLETVGRFQGPVDVQVADDFVKGTSETRITLELGGRQVRVHFAGPPPDSLMCGMFLEVEGVLAGDRIAASSSEVQAGVMAQSCSVTGDQRTVVLLVNFPNHTLPPYLSVENVRNFFFGNDGGTSLNGYWQETSYGLASASGDVFGPYQLGQNFTCDGYNAIRPAAIAAADADVDFRQYTRIFIVFPQSTCTFGGVADLGCSTHTSGDGQFTASGAFLWGTHIANQPDPRRYGVFVSAHEGGHNLGLHHANWINFGSEPLSLPGTQPVQILEYGDPFSAMGSPFYGHYAAPHKLRLGWLDPAIHVRTVTTDGTYSLPPYELATAGTRVLKVQRGTENEWLWVESRTNQSNYDCRSNEPQDCDGALIHYDLGNFFTYMIDFTRNTPFDINDAPLPTGSTFFDRYTGLSLTPAHGAGTLDVTATFGERTCHRPPIVQLSPAGQTVNNGTSVTFTVTVTNPDEASCPTASYQLSSATPGWAATFQPPTLDIAPGASEPSTAIVSVPRATEAGTYTVTVAAAWTTVTGLGTETVDVISNCVLGDPLVNVQPSAQNVAINEPANFTVEVRSTDTAGCGVHRFDITSTLPAGWSGTINPSFLNLAGNGPPGFVQLRKFIPAGTPIDSTHVVNAIGTSRPLTPPAVPHIGTDTAELTVKGPCTHAEPTVTASPTAMIAAPFDFAVFTGTVANNDSPTCAPVTFTLLVSGPEDWELFPVSDCIPACHPTLPIPPGESRPQPFGGSVPHDAQPGVYDIFMNVNSASHSGATVNVKVGVEPVCIPQNPTVTLSPSTVQRNAGQPASFTATIANNDIGSTCGPVSFALSASVPAGWGSSLASPVTVAPGASAQVPFTATSPVTAASGPYDVSVTATSTFRSGSGSAVVNVTAPPTTLEAGYGHSLSSGANGVVWAWGINTTGQLGDGTLTNRNGPVRSGSLTGILEVGAGVFHSVALENDGTVWAWGDNAQGQLGDGTTTPRNVPGEVPGLSGIVALASGASHSLALKSDGTVWAWGDNDGGQLGDGGTTDRHAPFQVPGLSGVTALAAGFYHSVALKSDGTVWTWGRNAEGELGDGTHTDRPTPGPVPGLTGVTRVSCGAYFTMTVLADGTSKGWGHNFFGQLGDGTTVERTTPVSVTGLTGVSRIAAGSAFTLALRGDGSVWSFGQNVAGQLGDGTTTHRSTPQQIAGLSSIVEVAAGEDHSLARNAAGLIYGWGKNLYGQIGAGPWPQTTPIVVFDESQPVPLGLISPVGGESWQPGSARTVSWTGQGPISVSLSLDAGETYTTLVSSTSLQDVPITVPADATTVQGRLRIDRVGPPASFAQTGAYLKIQHDPWLVTTVDASPPVTGEFASIALDPWGRTGIAYVDRTNGDLKFALRTGATWSIETVDAVNSTGWYTSLAFGGDGSPRISYMDGTRTYLRYAFKTGSVWTREDVANTNCTLPTSLGFDTADRPFIAIQDCASTKVKVFAKSGGVWSQIRSLTGASPSLRMHGNLPRISYFLHTANPTQLRYLSASGTFGSFTWTDEAVPGSGGATTSSIAMDSQGNPRISFYEAGTRSLRMAKKIGGAWSVEVVDATGGDVGNWSSIALDSSSRPRISYLANGIVKLAEWTGTAWRLDAVDVSGPTPAATALAVDSGGNKRIAYFDTAGGDLRYAISQPDVTPPATPSLVLDAGRTTIVVAWTAPGDDGSTGTASTYDLRRSSSPIDESNFAQATIVPKGPPGPAGMMECADFQSMPSCTPHYFALRVLDDLGNPSGLATGQIVTLCSGFQEVLCF
ncbi:MAG: NEW3 domain-containing protein [Candidatus Polarisedimenticolia bacterium]